MNNKSLFLAVSIFSFMQVACADNEKETVTVEKTSPVVTAVVEKVKAEPVNEATAAVKKEVEQKVAETVVAKKPAAIQQSAEPKQTPIAAGPAFIEGKDYAVIDGTKGINKAQIIEFFSYTCGHCYNMEGFLHKWLPKKSSEIEFVRIPVFLGQVPHLTQGYYAAEVLGVLDKTHMEIFNQWHREKNIIRTKQDLYPIFEKAGISNADFEKAYNSFGVASKVQHAKKMVKDFKVTSFPKFVVNQRYEIKDYQQLDRLLNQLPLEKAK